MKDFRLLQADLKPKELGSLCEVGHEVLQGSLGVGNKGSIVGIEEVPDNPLMSLCGAAVSSDEKGCRQGVADVNSILIINDVFCSLFKHHTKEDGK